MRIWRELIFILKHLNRSRSDEQLDGEMRAHLESEIQRNVERGMPPADARKAALRSFGNLTLAKEDSRAEWGLGSLERALQDLRYSFRLLSKDPAFSFVAILTLALGIGANTAIFSVVNGVLLNHLPYPDSERLVTFSFNQSLPDLDDEKTLSKSFDAMGGVVMQGLDYTGEAEPVQVNAALCNGDLFQALGAQPALGRVIAAEEDRYGGEPVVDLSYAFWQQHFGGNRDVLGKKMALSGVSYTVIGVMPATFVMPREKPDLWAAVRVANPVAAKFRGVHFLRTYLKLKKGVSLDQARVESELIDQWLAQHYPDENKGRHRSILPLKTVIVGDTGPALLILFGAVSLVLLIACANFASLLLARGAARHHEVVVRAALGAGRGRLLHQMLIESTVLSLIGGVFGVLLAQGAVRLLVSLKPANLPRLTEIGLDIRVLAFTFGVALLTGVVFGLPPAITASRANAGEALKEAGRGSTIGVGGQRIRRALVVGEVALALVLLIGAGLLIRGFWLLNRVNPGFDTNNLLTTRIELPEARYREIPKQMSFRTRLLDDLNSLNGVQAGIVSELPCTGDFLTHNFLMEGWPPMAAGEAPELQTRSISRNYLHVMGIPLLKGRDFTSADSGRSPVVGMVNEAFVRTYLKDKDPIGVRIRWSHEDTPVWMTIIGVVGDIKHFGLDQPEEPAFYGLYEQQDQPWKRWMYLTVRSNEDPKSLTDRVKAEVWKLDSQLPLTKVETMNQVLAESLAIQRFNTTVLAIFAAVALLLATVGIYGVVSYSAAQRTHEIGIRVALGARSPDVLALVVKQGLILAVIGVALGLGAAIAVTRFMGSLLYGVTATDPVTFAFVSLLLIVVTLAATVIPARRAARIDPMAALRYE